MDLIIKLLEKEDYPDTVNCVLNNFITGEPMINALGINFDEFKYFTEIYIKKAIEDKLSVIAKIDNKVIGALINEDLLTTPPQGFEQCTEKMNPIFEVLEKLDGGYIQKYQPEKNQVLHIFMGAVYKEYAGYAVTNKMLDHSFMHAKTKGYKNAVVETTGIISYNVIQKRKEFKKEDAITYSDYVYNGQRIFSNIKGGTQCALFIGNIQ